MNVKDQLQQLREEAVTRKDWYAADTLRYITLKYAYMENELHQRKAVFKASNQMSTPEFMHWIADRLISVYGESDSVDFVQSLRSRANELQIESQAKALARMTEFLRA